MQSCRRGKKLINLALRNGDGDASSDATNIKQPESHLPNSKFIQVINDKTAFLDEKTGHFDFLDSSQLNIVDLNTNIILDEVSGKFISIDDDQTESFKEESDFSDDNSEYYPDEIEYNSETSEFGNSSRVLDESSGNIKKIRARKGQGKKQNWARNRLKRKRMRGQEYASIKRKRDEEVVVEVRKERCLQARCDSIRCTKKFAKKCNEILEVDRQKIFDAFWNLSWDEKKAFVIAMVTTKPTKHNTGNASRRSNTLEYNLRVSNENKVVCKKMFCATLSLGEWSVLNWVKDSSSSEIAIAKKSKPPKRNKQINLLKAKHIHDFLTALPKMPSHYCRASTNFEYLDVNYTQWSEVYTDYEHYIVSLGVDKSQKSTYKSFLDAVHKTNIKLYKPKKDQCDLCFAYKNKNIDENKYQDHIKSKERARIEKAVDKARCLNNEIEMFTVDLQAVQNVPLILAGATYFKQKLSVHQFTIYNEKNKDVVCYVWHEGEGGMDSNIFTSCLLDHLENVSANNENSKPIVIYSDGCSAQNRNVNLANALQHFAINKNTEVYQKYLVVGHTQMECDSVHATIEQKKKNKELFVPADFNKIIRTSRQSQPYNVRYLDHTFFRDFTSLSYFKSIRPGAKKGDPCVVDLRAIKYTPEGVWYKLQFDDLWAELPHHRLNSRHRQQRGVTSSDITQLYHGPLAINKRKYDDLQDLKQLLPRDYHSFYDGLVFE